jgi:hypothetical protein
MASPTFWGHTAMHFTVRNRSFPHWAYDETIPPPDGVDLWRHTHTPIYAEPLASAVMNEIRRRSQTIAGRASPRHTRRFSGLVVCGECGAYLGLVVDNKSAYEAMRCNRHYSSDRYINSECSQSRVIHTKHIKTFVNSLLEGMLEQGIDAVLSPGHSKQERLQHLREYLTVKEAEMNSMVAGMRTVSPSNPAFSVYATQVEQIGTEIQGLRQELQVLEAEEQARERGDAARTLEEVRSMTLERFWGLPDREINQRLHTILFPYKIVVVNGEVIKLAQHQGRRARRPI